MTKNLSQNIKAFILGISCFATVTALSGEARGWTSAKLAEVDTVLTIAKEGPSRIATSARFEVFGGSFHGFDLAPFEEGVLVKEECQARLDDGRRYPLHFRTLYDGRTRVVLADKASIKRGGITFFLTHSTDLAEGGSLRSYTGRARLDWTPIIWDDGTNKMTVTVELPGRSEDAPVYLDPDVTKDYIVESQAEKVVLTKHRTVKWYPMQVVMDFDPSLVNALSKEAIVDGEEPGEESKVAAAVSAPAPKPPLHIAALPYLAVLFGLLLSVRKSHTTQRALWDLQLARRFRLLPGTSFPLRVFLSVGAAGLALFAQHKGSLAAGILPMAVASALWLMRKQEGSTTPRSGGSWRRMDDNDLAAYGLLCSQYLRRRRSFLDISTFGGVVAFLSAAAAVGYGIYLSRGSWPRISWALALNALIWAAPIWFASVRSELPVDPTIEGFFSLRKWRSALSKVVGAKVPGADASFWVREDDKGAIEVRLRVENPPVDIKGIEIAGEMIKSGAKVKARKAIILRMEPGTPAARRLAACPYAVEHHLTPDLEEEIILLRNRRGPAVASLAPLKAAIGMVRTVARA